jgi:diguanylate cyclase (GGDEF)-like protein/PAS domain S-box-containing protein
VHRRGLRLRRLLWSRWIDPSKRPDRGPTGSHDVRAILNGLPAMVGYWDANLRNRMANDAYLHFVGKTPEQMLGIHISESIGPERYPTHLPHIEAALAGEPQLFDSMIVAPGRPIRYTQVSYTPDKVDGAVRGFFVLVTDITRRRNAEQALQAAEARFRTLFEFAPIGMFIAGEGGRILDVNRAGAELVGGTRTSLLGTRVRDLTHPDDRESSREHLERLLAGEIDSYCLERRYVHADGHTIWTQLNVTAMPEDPDLGVVALAQIQDVSERRDHEAQLRQLADRDAMSGLLNHRAFMVHVERQAATAARHGTGGALLVIDLDGFKQVNDVRGHQAGNALIVEVGELLRGRVRLTDVVGRIGGDEFAVIAPFGDLDDGRLLGEALLEVLRRRPDAHGLQVTASIGIASFERGNSAEDVLAAADAAMYCAKGAGGDRVAVDARAA